MTIKEALAERKSRTHRRKAITVAGVCPKHGFWRGSRCEKCDKEVNESPQVMLFTPYLYEDICETPIYITSKRQLKEECRKRNLVAVRLL